LVDLDDRCGSHQSYDEDQSICVCDAEYALIDGACTACGEHEVGSPDGCVCEPGYSREDAESACALAGGLGKDCESDDDCDDARYSHCQLPSQGDGAGYCTNADCSSSADCQGDYACNDRETPSFCERPPSGLGKACSSSDDCEGNEASYCESVSAHSCVVNDCAPDPNKCHGDWVCCDIGLLSQSLCIPPSELSDGHCPAGGTLVPREAP
jgi:hypothetical protein